MKQNIPLRMYALMLDSLIHSTLTIFYLVLTFNLAASYPLVFYLFLEMFLICV